VISGHDRERFELSDVARAASKSACVAADAAAKVLSLAKQSVASPIGH
jgi:hypothetical protein